MPITNERYINELRIRDHKIIDSQLTIIRRETTITTLVRMIDELRQPYNNGTHHSLYLKATNLLNELEDREEIPHGSSWAP